MPADVLFCMSLPYPADTREQRAGALPGATGRSGLRRGHRLQPGEQQQNTLDNLY